MRENGFTETNVFIGLMTVGYNVRYANLKSGNLDALQSMKEGIADCADTCDVDIIDEIREHTLFRDAKSSSFRLDRAKMGEAEKDAMHCGVDRSELNLYNAMTGLERLLSEDPYYIGKQDERLFRVPMDEFMSANRRLEFRLVSLRSILAMG